MASDALVLVFVPLQKFPIDLKIFQWNCQCKMMKFQACMTYNCFSKLNIQSFLDSRLVNKSLNVCR